MKRKTYALAAGIVPFITAVPLPVHAKGPSGVFAFEATSVTVAARNAIAGFPLIDASVRDAMQAKPPKPDTKPTKCPPTPSKPTKKTKCK